MLQNISCTYTWNTLSHAHPIICAPYPSYLLFYFFVGREVEDKQSKVPCTWAGACAWLVLPLSTFFLCFLMLRPWQEADNSAASGRMIRDPQNRHGKHTGNIYWKFKEYQNLENTAASKKTRILNHLFLFLCLRKWWICLLDEASHLFPPAKRGNARHIFFFNGKAIRHRAARHAGRVWSIPVAVSDVLLVCSLLREPQPPAQLVPNLVAALFLSTPIFYND